MFSLPMNPPGLVDRSKQVGLSTFPPRCPCRHDAFPRCCRTGVMLSTASDDRWSTLLRSRENGRTQQCQFGQVLLQCLLNDARLGIELEKNMHHRLARLGHRPSWRLIGVHKPRPSRNHTMGCGQRRRGCEDGHWVVEAAASTASTPKRGPTSGSGKTKRKQVPWPGLLMTAMRPPSRPLAGGSRKGQCAAGNRGD